MVKKNPSQGRMNYPARGSSYNDRVAFILRGVKKAGTQRSPPLTQREKLSESRSDYFTGQSNEKKKKSLGKLATGAATLTKRL